MKKPFLRFLATAGFTLALTGVGCDDGKPAVSSSNEEVTVHGTVKLKGAALKKGMITFNPANVNRKTASAVQAKLGEDGSYTIKTLVGQNQVSVDSPEAAKDPKIGYYTKTVELTSGDNTLDVELAPQ